MQDKATKGVTRRRRARAAHNTELVHTVLRFLGVPRGQRLTEAEVAKAENRLGLTKPDAGAPFSHERGRMLRIAFRLMELRMVPDLGLKNLKRLARLQRDMKAKERGPRPSRSPGLPVIDEASMVDKRVWQAPPRVFSKYVER